MSIKHVSFALDGVPGLTATQRLVLVSLGEWANDDGICWPSHERIATRAGIGRRQVMRVLEQLETMAVIELVDRKQYSNVYQIRCDIAMSDVTSAKTTMSDVTFGAPDVTSATSRCDIAMSGRCDIAMSHRTVKNHIEPPEEPLEGAREPKSHVDTGRVKAAKRATRAPDSFEPTGEQIEWAWSECQLVAEAAARETAKFLDYHRAKGSTFKDWSAAWRNWMRNSVRFSGNGRRPRSVARETTMEKNMRNLAEAFGRSVDDESDVYETTGRMR